MGVQGRQKPEGSGRAERGLGLLGDVTFRNGVYVRGERHEVMGMQGGQGDEGGAGRGIGFPTDVTSRNGAVGRGEGYEGLGMQSGDRKSADKDLGPPADVTFRNGAVGRGEGQRLMDTQQGQEGATTVGKFSVDKGKRFERELVQLFSAAAPGARICRGFQWRDGAEAPDVDIPGFWLEAKVGVKTNCRKALRQATEATQHGRWPLAVCKDDRQTPLAVMALPDFLTMFRQWYAGRTAGEAQ